MKAKLQAILAQLNVGLVEREQVLKTTLLAVLAGENPVLIGPPGTGKSLMARRMADALAQDCSDYFEYLLTKFSTPEEIFGPLSISELKADRFKRNTAGYLPTVKLAFLDEIFKASSSILNALLTILNERIYHNGAEPQRVPLQALIAASNELPNDQEELSALYDRFLVRVFVDYVSDAGLSRLFETTTEPQWSAETQLQGHELQRIREAAHAVQLPPEIVQAMQRIWALHRETFKEDRRESLSDRRLKKIIYLLRVSAATNGRREVDLSDVLLLKDCLWNHPDNAVKVLELVLKTLQGFSRQVPYHATPQLAGSAAEAPVYELEQDGHTLVPVKNKPTKTAVATRHAIVPSHAQKNNVVKGFKGSGTEQDPLLIETVDDFLDLERPEVGQQGYHFRQIANLDFSAISTWPQISFKGFYDGAKHTINNDENFNFSCSQSWNNIYYKEFPLFANVFESEIINLSINNYVISSNIRKSTISACESNGFLILNASECVIKNCKSIGSIAENIDSSEIVFCQSNAPIVLNRVVASHISNCISILKKDDLLDFKGGVAYSLSDESIVDKCYVSGNVKLSGSDYCFSGISQDISSSILKNSAVGSIFLERGQFWGRIAYKVRDDSLLENISSIDANSLSKDKNAIDGQSIAAARFNQRYFEHTLGWDFDTVWAWDIKNKHPVLRQVGLQAAANYAPAKPSATPTEAQTTDLLTQQIRANIWL